MCLPQRRHSFLLFQLSGVLPPLRDIRLEAEEETTGRGTNLGTGKHPVLRDRAAD